MYGLTVMRTANAGVLLELDGKRILLDGVCEPLYPYLGTPNLVKEFLIKEMPDVLAFTHKHTDHYDINYEKTYKEKTLGTVLGPESLIFYESNGLKISLVPTRHIGKTDIAHVSYVIKGSSTVWFMGDASPSCLNNLSGYDTPDLLIVPFGFAITPSAWRMAKETGAKRILLVHMPLRKDDREGIFEMVENVTQNDPKLFSLDVGEKITL